MKTGDKIVISIVVLSLIVFAFIWFNQDQESDRTVEIWFDGELFSTELLAEEYKEVLFQRNNMENLIIIEGNGVYIERANCPTQQCVHQGKVSMNNQTIVCLPHRLVVKVVITDSDEVDTIVR